MYTIDDFLGGLVRLKQPEKGLRATSDAVLLAACVPDSAKGKLLDVGCGVGILALSTAKRAKGITTVGVDIQEELISLAKENAAINELSDRVAFLCQDIMERGFLKGETFDYVITNPPFYAENPSATPLMKAIAHHEGESGFLANWVNFSVRHLKAKGRFIMLHKAERLPEILSLLCEKLGDLSVKPLYSRKGDSASRVIVSGVLNSKKPFRVLPPLIVHESDGAFTQEAKAILMGDSDSFCDF